MTGATQGAQKAQRMEKLTGRGLCVCVCVCVCVGDCTPEGKREGPVLGTACGFELLESGLCVSRGQEIGLRGQQGPDHEEHCMRLF